MRAITLPVARSPRSASQKATAVGPGALGGGEGVGEALAGTMDVEDACGVPDAGFGVLQAVAAIAPRAKLKYLSRFTADLCVLIV